VVRDAMKAKKMVGIARLVISRLVISRRERVMMIEPHGKGLLGTTLLYAYEVRGEDTVFDEIPEIKLPQQMMDLAEAIIDKMSGAFDASEFTDRYEEAVIELIQKKQAGQPVVHSKRASQPANVVNLMDALRRSMTGAAKPSRKASKEIDERSTPKKKRAKG